MQLRDKVALVTGAGSGIGRACAELFVSQGARVIALDRDGADLKEVLQKIKDGGGEAIPAFADISHSGALKEAIDSAVAKWGRLDVVVANAGVNGVWAPIEELADDEWARTLSINLTGTFLTIKHAVPYLKRRGGSVVVVSSINGTRVFSNTGASAYSSSKAGQVALAKMLALELAEWKVRVNVICPGAIRTNIDESTERRDLKQVETPIEFPEGEVPLRDGRPGTPEQVAQLMLFLASDASDLITGTEIWIDGAESLLRG